MVKPEVPRLAEAQAENIVYLLMKDFNPEEQNAILKTVVQDLKKERQTLADKKQAELQKLMQNNAVLFQYSV